MEFRIIKASEVAQWKVFVWSNNYCTYKKYKNEEGILSSRFYYLYYVHGMLSYHSSRNKYWKLLAPDRTRLNGIERERALLFNLFLIMEIEILYMRKGYIYKKLFDKILYYIIKQVSILLQNSAQSCTTLVSTYIQKLLLLYKHFGIEIFNVQEVPLMEDRYVF